MTVRYELYQPETGWNIIWILELDVPEEVGISGSAVSTPDQEAVKLSESIDYAAPSSRQARSTEPTNYILFQNTLTNAPDYRIWRVKEARKAGESSVRRRCLNSFLFVSSCFEYVFGFGVNAYLDGGGRDRCAREEGGNGDGSSKRWPSYRKEVAPSSRAMLAGLPNTDPDRFITRTCLYQSYQIPQAHIRGRDHRWNHLYLSLRRIVTTQRRQGHNVAYGTTSPLAEIGLSPLLQRGGSQSQEGPREKASLGFYGCRCCERSVRGVQRIFGYPTCLLCPVLPEVNILTPLARLRTNFHDDDDLASISLSDPIWSHLIFGVHLPETLPVMVLDDYPWDFFKEMLLSARIAKLGKKDTKQPEDKEALATIRNALRLLSEFKERLLDPTVFGVISKDIILRLQICTTVMASMHRSLARAYEIYIETYEKGLVNRLLDLYKAL
ncbi:hypothetical protein EV421DRAFT_2025852 [Armillaria borealis]|uniref:Uncharacterized protein n=1 Tax=Armillaria borealis TaxID=47425 RepID=A0AA39ITR0_9AGAR|nr:hypothetical protein EV421DRAFT_2025852 [Armillaria borealis]